MPRDSLLEIGNRYGTDKPGHGYLPYYDEIFTPRRDEPLKFMEIGICNEEPVNDPNGGSLRMWKEYFPNADVFGVDKEPYKVITEDRIRVFTGLQGDKTFLATVVAQTGPLDIVVDDGSHCSTDHLASFSALWPQVNPGGWYCIEDCVSIFVDSWSPPGEPTILDLLWGRMRSILSTGVDEINEVRIIGDGPNDGLVMFRKRK